MSTIEAPGTFVSREIPELGTLTFEEHKAGTPHQKTGELRKRDYRAYKLDGKQLVSVTTILSAVLPAPGLIKWAEDMGARGAWELAKAGLLPKDPKEVIGLIRQHKLGADAARESGATRGLNIHALWEQYDRTGTPPNPSEHPEAHRPFIRGMVKWLIERKPKPVEDSIERIVCHPKLGYAGRMDRRAIIDGLDLVVDAKTQANGGIYDKAVIQVEMYHQADIACGASPADGTLVVVFDEHGGYHELRGNATAKTVECVCAHYQALKPITRLLDDRYWDRRRAREAKTA